MIRIVAPMVALAAVVVLAGCVPTQGSVQPTKQATSAPTVSPSVPPDPHDPVNWVVSDAGIGPFAIGADLKALEPQYPWLVVSTAVCSNPNAVFLNSAKLSLAMMTDSSGRIAGVSAGGGPTVSSGVPTAPADPKDGPRTTSGIGFGSALAALTAAYPTTTKKQRFPDDGLPYFVVPGSAATQLSFGTDDPPQNVTSVNVWPGGLPPYEYCG